MQDKPALLEIVPYPPYRPALPPPRTARLSEVGGWVALVALTAASISRRCLRVAMARAREERRPTAQLLRILVADAVAESRHADVAGASHA